jgi:rubrerythrin
MASVELHPAFLWTCDECGRDSFARAILVDPESLDAADRERLDAILGEGWDGAEALMAPAEVTCPYCGATYEAEHPC